MEWNLGRALGLNPQAVCLCHPKPPDQWVLAGQKVQEFNHMRTGRGAKLLGGTQKVTWGNMCKENKGLTVFTS